MLKIKNLHTYYGNIHALQGINLEVPAGKIVTLIGSNGAGKSTTVLSIAGVVPVAPESEILFEGKNITNMPAHQIVKAGLNLSPEGREVFSALSVEENLRLGAYTRRKNKAEVERGFERVYQLFPRLAERKTQASGTLSGGEQQMLAIGRALMSSPKLLLLDEPSLGLAPNLVQMIFELIRDINKQGVTILLIEQNANMALKIADYGYVMETGKVILENDANILRRDDGVRKAYLGKA